MEFSLLWLLVYPLLVTGQADECIDNRQEEWENQLLGYKLTCRNNGVLVGLNVTAGLGRCPPDSSKCKGLTPYLIEEEHNCYWRNDCSVLIPKRSAIDIIVKANDIQCFGLSPEYLKISDVACLERSNTRDILDFSTLGIAQNGCIKTAFESGIIRSHSFYPWDYEGASRVFDKGNYCIEVYTKNTLGMENLLKLVVTIKDFDMGEKDSLTLGSIGGKNAGKVDKIDSTAVGKSFIYSAATLDAGVQINMSIFISSIGGRGFILCVAHVRYSKSDPDACAEVVSKGFKTPMYKDGDVEVSDVPGTPTTIASSPTTPKPLETCRDCKKRCRKVPRKERRKCKKGCKPPQCIKGPKRKKKQKGSGKKKGSKKSKKGA